MCIAKPALQIGCLCVKLLGIFSILLVEGGEVFTVINIFDSVVYVLNIRGFIAPKKGLFHNRKKIIVLAYNIKSDGAVGTSTVDCHFKD